MSAALTTRSGPGWGETSEVPISANGEARSLHVLVTAIAHKENIAEEQAAVKGNSLVLCFGYGCASKGSKKLRSQRWWPGEAKTTGCGDKSKTRPSTDLFILVKSAAGVKDATAQREAAEED